MKKLRGALLLAPIGMTGCHNQQTADKPQIVDPKAGTAADTVPPGNAVNTHWLEQFYLDGDQMNDAISFDFSGGAHCCYQIKIVLSNDHKEQKFPFEMDGGYIAGVNNSQPEQLDIRDIDNDGLPEILMRIQTYNGEPETIPAKWKADYGINSNYMVT